MGEGGATSSNGRMDASSCRTHNSPRTHQAHRSIHSISDEDEDVIITRVLFINVRTAPLMASLRDRWRQSQILIIPMSLVRAPWDGPRDRRKCLPLEKTEGR